MQRGTYTVLERKDDLEGFTIDPGTISSVRVQGEPLNIYTEIEFYIEFLPFNDIPSTGRIDFVFPAEFISVNEQTCQIVRGLTSSSTINCTTTGLTVTITNFRNFEAEYIGLYIMATNPATSGQTSYFEIYTYYDDGITVIDQNTQAAVLTISSVQHPEFVTSNMYKVKIDAPIGTFGPIDMFLHLKEPLPATTGSDIGKLTLDLPENMAVPDNMDGLYCTLGEDRVPASYCELTCIGTCATRQIEMHTPSTEDFGSCPLAVTITTIGDKTETDFGFKIPFEDKGI
mmetsp:Transcript_22880/g.11047  ORF Transcript_22880/g.11047 Transcript_22880/m.11047 type:complete len:286 (-) Transcript_22880:5844-6701(-)